MGSKMAAATRVIQVVKPHTPLIKFPDRKSGPRPKMPEVSPGSRKLTPTSEDLFFADIQMLMMAKTESLQASVPLPHASKVQEPAGGRPLAFQSISPVSRVQGAPDTSELARILPQKYRRKVMSVEEIEYIQRGGPE